MKKIALYAFILLVIVQWMLPGNMLWTRHTVVSKGRSFRFQTEPVDPVNPFKGRYVALNFKENSFRASKSSDLKTGIAVYVIIDTTKDGYAHIKNVLSSRPPAGTDYITTTINYLNTYEDATSTILQFKFPFDEYYMQEFKAPKAEKMYRDSSRNEESTYAVVKIYKGDCVLDGLFINHQPVESLIK